MDPVVLKGVEHTFREDRKYKKPPVAAAPDVAEWVRTRLGFQPDQRQMAVLRSTARRGILNCTRQWGKSTLGAAMAAHRVWTRAGSLVLIASRTERQSNELLMKASGMLGRLGLPQHRSWSSKAPLLLPNGSRIVALPGVEASIRSYSAVSLLLIDEASRVEEEMYMALRPMLAVSNGDLWLLSTPWGKSGFFYEAWEHGGDEWFRMSVPATECPRIPKEFLEEERRAMGATWFDQEYCCGFVDNGTSVFARDVVEAALDDSVEPLVFD